jgi:hypothetical protein
MALPGYRKADHAGRLVQVSLGLIVADRPAAIDITGGPHYKATDSPCLRCEISVPEIPTLRTFPSRDAHAHNLASFKFSKTVPIAVAADKQKWQASKRAKKAREYSGQRKVEIKTKAEAGAQGNLSPTAVIPGYPKFRLAVFDPMHSCCEGVVATCTRKGMQEGKFGYAEMVGKEGLDAQQAQEAERGEGDAERGGERTTHLKLVEAIKRGKANLRGLRQGIMPVQSDSQIAELADSIKSMEEEKVRRYGDGPIDAGMNSPDIAYLQKCIAEVIMPRSTVRLNPAFGTPTGGSPSASQWRSWATVIGPLVLPNFYFVRGPTAADPRQANHHLSSAELCLMMGMFEIMVLAFRSSISEEQIVRLEELIPRWLRLVFKLHPKLEETTNFHVLTHLAEDIRKFGPIYGWWSFLVERINFVIKHFNRSGGCHDQEQVVAYKAMLRCGEVLNVRLQQFGPNWYGKSASGRCFAGAGYAGPSWQGVRRGHKLVRGDGGSVCGERPCAARPFRRVRRRQLYDQAWRSLCDSQH